VDHFAEEMMTMHDGGLDEVRKWVLDKHPELEDIDIDLDIIDSRIVSSLEFISLLLFVEELRGEPLMSDDVQLESFRTLRLINDNFLTR
jgi:hypothetical protein